MRTILIISLLIHGVAYSQNQILGTWFTENKDGKVQIYQQNNKYFGKIIWLKEPLNKSGKLKVDSNNPNVSLNTKPIIGLIILKDFQYKDSKWQDGTIYDPKSGKTYDCTLWLENSNILNVRGYVGFIHSTTQWIKIEK